MDEQYAGHIAALAASGRIPHDSQAVFVAGSVVRGWGNAGSDIDIYVICDRAPTGVTGIVNVALWPDAVLKHVTTADGRRLDVEYWQDSQVEQLLHKVSWQSFDADQAAGDRLTRPELNFLERLDHAVVISGADWMSQRRRQFRATALRSMLVSRALNFADLFVEDAVGQLESGDLESAVLSVRLAFGNAIDALLAGEGQFGQCGKWRARRFRDVEQDVISFEDYWAIETMRGLDPDDPAAWVRKVITACREVALKVVI